MMSVSRRAVLSLAMIVSLVPPALSHSLKEVEQNLLDQEKYFQPVDSQAPDFTLQDADGRAFRLTDFKGKIVVLNFIYTYCPDVCPLQSEKIADIQNMVNITPMKTQVQFVSITTDPKRDTAQVLRDYGENHGLDPVNWIFLTAMPDQPEDLTRKLASSYGVDFTIVENSDGEQVHGVVTNVIDQDGRLRARFHSLRFQNVNFVMFVNALINKVQVPHGDAEPGFWARLKEWF